MQETIYLKQKQTQQSLLPFQVVSFPLKLQLEELVGYEWPAHPLPSLFESCGIQNFHYIQFTQKI